MRARLRGLPIVCLFLLGACGESPGTADSGGLDGGPRDAATDGGAGADAGIDSGTDAGSDAGAPSDAATDAGRPEVPEEYTLILFERPTGTELATPYGMNELGVIVGSAGPEAWSPVAVPVQVALEDDGIAPLEAEGAMGYARGVSDDGTIVGEHDRQAQVWSRGVRTPLPVPAGYFSGAARAINSSGAIAGSYADHDDPPPPVGPRPCAWASRTSAPVALALLHPDWPVGSAAAIDSRGAMAGTLSTISGTFAVIWDRIDAAPRALPLPTGALGVEAMGMNDHGDVVGRAARSDGSDAFAYWSTTGTSALLARPTGAPSTGFYAEARDVDGAGWAVGTATTAPGVAHAILWADGRAIDLDASVTDRPAGVRHIAAAAAIDDQGRIAVDVLLDGPSADLPHTIGVLVPAP